MFVAVFFTQKLFSYSIISVLLLAAEGMAIYFGLLFLFRDETVMTLISAIKRTVSKRRNSGDNK